MKGINDENGKNREEENITQNERKAKIKTEKWEFKIDQHNGRDEEDEQIKEDTGNEKEKNAEPENKQ